MSEHKKKTLTSREELFCTYYAATQNAREAAIKSGCNTLFAEKTAVKLMRRSEISNRIAELCEKEKAGKNIRRGLERLAFGSITDAITLLLAEESSELDVGRLDLFAISEIKKQKGGGFEMKFFDRLKAFEKLAELEGNMQSDSAVPFYAAIEKGVSVIESSNDES